RWPLQRARLDRAPMHVEQLSGTWARDDLAVAERRVSGDMIEVPMAENDRDPVRSEVLERVSHGATMADADAGVEDEGLPAVDHGVAADAERQGTFLDPRGHITGGGVAAGIEPVQVVVRVKDV